MVRRAATVLLSVLLAVGVASACSSDPPKRPGYAADGTPSPSVSAGSGEGGVDGAAGDSGGTTDGGSCTDIVLKGTLVDRVGVLGDPPVSLGGAVADGTYDLTLYQVYVGVSGVGGPTGLTARSTIRIASGTIEEILETGGSTPLATARSKSLYSATSATFVTTELCPKVGAGTQRQFTATDPQIVFTDPVTKEAFTFNKR